MWRFRSEELPGRRGLRFAVDFGEQPAPFANVLRGWQDDAAFRSLFNGQLADTPFSAFRWETPPVTTATRARPFEFVLLDSPELAGRSDPEAFSEHFADPPESGVVVFPNLGEDALLVVPCPIAAPSAYGHLAAFVWEAPYAQTQALWRLVGETMARRVGAKPVWLSTAGAGVAWLHVRLDDRPKYYGYWPYRHVGPTAGE
jgi:hypothetical protein